MQLTILTPQKKLLVDQEAKEVFVPAHKGEMHILPGHAPLMTTMKTGVLRYTPEGGSEEKVVVSWGYAEVSPKGVNILAETAETAAEIDLDRAKKAEQEAEQKLAAMTLEAEEIEKNLRKAERARARMEVGN